MGGRILVVDDETGPRESLRMILNHDHDVRTASRGSEALAMIRADPPDLVFLDIRMAGMEGTEVLRRIKEIAPKCEVAMITAYAAVQSAQCAIRLGALDYITKPFGVAEIEEVVERALARRRREKEEQVLLKQLEKTITHLSEQIDDATPRESVSHEALSRDLASAHNSIEDQLNEMLRLSSIGEMAAEVAHDMNNFLSTILFRIEVMLLDLEQSGEVDPQTLADGLQQMALAARDGGEALDRISALTASSPYEPTEQVDLNQILRESVELSEGRIEKSDDHALVFDLDELPQIEGSATGLRTTFTNLIINAYHALAEADRPGTITILTRAEDDRVVAQITDEGVGMSKEIISHLADPFFTTKDEDGTGLGLTVGHKVVDQHNGSICFDSTLGVGTTVTVKLPVCQPHFAEEAMPSVLVVDDNASMRRVTREVLASDGYRVRVTSSGEEAIRRFEEMARDAGQITPRVVVTDLVMPGLSGVELARRVRKIAPDTIIIILSAFTDEADAEELEIADMTIRKPCDLRELSRRIGQLLDDDRLS